MVAASVFQRNKKLYLEQEAKLTLLLRDQTFLETFENWMNASIAQLDMQFETCEQQLGELQQSVAVDEGTYWTTKTLMQHCNLHIDQKRLIRRGAEINEFPSFADLVKLISNLNSLKTKGFISPKQAKFIEHAEAELQKVYFESKELSCVSRALETKLNDESTNRNVVVELTGLQNAIEELAPDLDACEQLLESAISNGDMALAEDISTRQVEMYEHMLALITEQYPIIQTHHADAAATRRRRRWTIFRLASRDITTVIEGKFRQIEACEDDLSKIREQVGNYSTDDAYQKKRYDVDKEDSNVFLDQNKQMQQSVWNKIATLHQELQTAQQELGSLAMQRQKELERRLRVEEREAGRRSGHESFLRIAAEHAQLLQDTIDNALAAKDIAIALNEFVLDGADSVTDRFDRQQKALSEMLNLVQNHHFRVFSDFYVASSRYLYRKERKMDTLNKSFDDNTVQKEMASETFDPVAKKFADLNKDLLGEKRQLADEIVSLRHRIEAAERAVAPTLQQYNLNKVPYVHPKDLAAKISVDRAEKMLTFREIVNPSHSKHAVALDEEEAGYTQKKLEVDTIDEARRAAKAMIAPKPPQGANAATRQQYQRFQAILEKKLEVPKPQQPDVGESRGDLAAAERPVAGATSEAWGSTGAGGARGGGGGANGVGGNHQHQPSTASTIPAGGVGRILGTGANVSNTVGGGGKSAPGSAMPPRMEGATFRAMYRYKSRAPDELSFEKGENIFCISAVSGDEGWYRGMCNQRTGLFPVNYVELVDELSMM